MFGRKDIPGVEKYNDDFGANFRRIERTLIIAPLGFENEVLRETFDW